jgi:hypothetical protein
MAGTGPAMTKHVFIRRCLAMRKPFLHYLASDGVRSALDKTIGTNTHMREAII